MPINHSKWLALVLCEQAVHCNLCQKVKSRKYRGIFKVKSREKTRQIQENWSQQLEYKQVQMRGTEPGVLKSKRSLLACHACCKCSMETTSYSLKVKLGIKEIDHEIGEQSDRWESHCNWWRVNMSFNIRKRRASYCWIRSPYRPLHFLNDHFQHSTRYHCLSSLLESRLALRIKHPNEEQAQANRKSWKKKRHRPGKMKY